MSAAMLTGGSASAAGGWQLQAHIPSPDSEYQGHSGFLGLSCPSTQLCVAVGEESRVASSTDPTGGNGAWHLAHPTVTGEDHPPQQPPPGYPDIHPPSNREPVAGFRDVSCPTAGFCVAVTFQGDVFWSHDPNGGDDAWNDVDVDGTGRDTHLMAVSCPSASLCVAVSGERYTGGKILSSNNPDGGTAAWQVVQLDESLDLRGISCGTPKFCVAVAQNGRMLESTNPTGPAGAWNEVGTPGGPGNLKGVSCVAALFCVAGNSGGNFLTSTDPVGSASSWKEADGGGSVQITDISCLPSRQCAAVDNNGYVLTTDDPTGGRGAWSRTDVLPFEDPASELEGPLNALFGVSCVSSSFCAASGADGRVYTSTDPFDAPPAGKNNGSGPPKHARRPRRPRVTISEAHAGYQVRNAHMKSGVFFRFHANGRVKGFLCSRDGRPSKPCRSPVRYKVAVGRHVFRVRAIGLTGIRGPIVTKRFKVMVNPAYEHHH